MTTTPTNILLIEDDAADVYMLRRVLRAAGGVDFNVQHVDRLEPGLERLASGGIDVLLLDLDLPDSFGLETFHKVSRLMPTLPVLVLTGLDDEAVALSAVRDGAQDYLVKGDFEGQLLVRAIRYAIERTQLQQRLRNLSLEDDLTGLYNRRGLLTLGAQQLRLARRNGTSLILVFADLDDLKEINDTRGHLVGSQAIAEAAAVLRETFRDTDVLARWGGDEFVVLLVETADFEGPAVRLQQRIDELNRRPSRPYRLSLSLGTATFDPENPCSLEQLIQRADEAMYVEKRSKPPNRQPRD